MSVLRVVCGFGAVSGGLAAGELSLLSNEGVGFFSFNLRWLLGSACLLACLRAVEGSTSQIVIEV